MKEKFKKLMRILLLLAIIFVVCYVLVDFDDVIRGICWISLALVLVLLVDGVRWLVNHFWLDNPDKKDKKD